MSSRYLKLEEHTPMQKDYLGKKIAIPVSREFVQTLFYLITTVPYRRENGTTEERLLSREFTPQNLYGVNSRIPQVPITVTEFLENQFIAVESEVKSKLKFYQQSDIEYHLIHSDKNRGTFYFITSGGQVDFEIYCKNMWDAKHARTMEDLGPYALIIEWKIRKPYRYIVMLVDAFVERIKAFDDFISKQPNISVRMRGNKPVTQGVKNLAQSLTRGTNTFPGLPENVMRSFIQPSIGNTTAHNDPALALAPLVKGGRKRRPRKTRKQKRTHH